MVGWDQIALPLEERKRRQTDARAAGRSARIKQNGGEVSRSANDALQAAVSQSERTDRVVALAAATISSIAGPAAAGLARPDRQRRHQGLEGHVAQPLGKWRAAGARPTDAQDRSRPARRRTATAASRSSTEHSAPCAASRKAVRHQTHVYRLSPMAAIVVENIFMVDKALPDLPRLGVVLMLQARLREAGWFGRGPLENYCGPQTLVA